MRKRLLVIGVLVVLAAGLAVVMVSRDGGNAGGNATAARESVVAAPVKAPRGAVAAPAAAEPSESEPDAAAENDDPSPLPPDEQADADEESKVEAFDNLTDKWMEPSSTSVTLSDIDAFAAAFRRLPEGRRDECIHRALNLIPDENVMLLVGVLMDKSMDRETVETVFNDVLNRDESVKRPILREIYRDKTHPCWADVAWIFDVTGEKPN